jgi:hypothetical protein
MALAYAGNHLYTFSREPKKCQNSFSDPLIDPADHRNIVYMGGLMVETDSIGRGTRILYHEIAIRREKREKMVTKGKTVTPEWPVAFLRRDEPLRARSGRYYPL